MTPSTGEAGPRATKDRPENDTPKATTKRGGDKLRVSGDDHLAFRESIARPTERFDEIDHSVADVRPAQLRSEREISRVLDILDELDREGGSA